MNPPTIPSELLDGWAKIEETEERVFDIKLVTVTANTIVYRDEELAERYDDETLRFFFATRLTLEPRVSHSGPLRQLIRKRSDAGFRDELENRGFTSIRAAGTTQIDRSNSHRATKVRQYNAAVELPDTTVTAVGLAGVWEGRNGEFGFAGGAYPTKIDGARPSWLDEEAMEADLLRLIREASL